MSREDLKRYVFLFGVWLVSIMIAGSGIGL